MSIVKPRSRCPRCLAWIAWYDNIPVASWILLGGKCRGCRGAISPRYALVELLTGALYVYAAWRQLYGSGDPGFDHAVTFSLHAWFLGALIVCTFVDYDFRILPDEVTLSGVGIGLAVAVAFPPDAPFGPFEIDKQERLVALLNSGLGAAVGFCSIWWVGVLGKLVFRKDAMGFGDVKFMAMVGAVLGWKGVLLTLLLACLFGSIFGIAKLIVLRRMGYVAFGPFLAAGALVMLFWAPFVLEVIDAYMQWSARLLG